jgi:hypothetical protein
VLDRRVSRKSTGKWDLYAAFVKSWVASGVSKRVCVATEELTGATVAFQGAAEVPLPIVPITLLLGRRWGVLTRLRYRVIVGLTNHKLLHRLGRSPGPLPPPSEEA